MIAGLGVGGAELMLKRLVLVREGEARDGTVHSVISLGELGEVGARLRAEGIAVEALGMRSALGVPRALFRLRERIAALRPDVVQTWMYHADLLGGLAARAAGARPVVWGIRASTMVQGTSRGTRIVRSLCARLSAQLPAAIICAAQEARRVHAAIGYDDSRMLVIPNGFDLPAPVPAAATAALRAACGWGGDELVIGTVGRFDPYKDYANFVRAASHVAVAEPRARFLMVGKGLSPDNAELMGWITRAGLAQRVALLGARSDVPECLAALDVFVLPSCSEGFPNVVGEAMAMGVSCVVTDVGDAALLVGDTGTVVPPRDATALGEAILGMLSLGAEGRTAAGARARERIRAEFPMTRTRERFAAVHARVAASVAARMVA